MLGLKQASSAPTCSVSKCNNFTCSYEKNGKTMWYGKCDDHRAENASRKKMMRQEAKAKVYASIVSGSAIESALCCKCGLLPYSMFDTHANGKPFAWCKPCYASVQARNTKRRRTSEGRAYNAAFQKDWRLRPEGIAWKDAYKESGKLDVVTKRSNSKATLRRAQDPRRALNINILKASSCLIRGEYATSPQFLTRTGWASEAAFLEHLRGACAAQCIDFDNRKSWQLEHKIPREAFDFDNPEDVRRCWSAANVHVMTVADNQHKSWKLIDHWIASAGVDCFPAAWMGAPPTEEMKKAHHDKCVAEKALADAADLEEDAEESGEESEEEFEERGEGSGSMQGEGSSA